MAESRDRRAAGNFAGRLGERYTVSETALRSRANGLSSRRTAGALTAISALLLDQLSKHLIFANVRPGDELVLGPNFSVLPGWNEGTAFGLAQATAPLLLVALALGFTAWLTALVMRTPSSSAAVGLGATIGGALANVADRLRYGAVRDFIDVHWNALHWPTFNGADIFVVGGLLLFIAADFQQDRKKREAA